MALGDNSSSSGGQPQIQVPVAPSTELALTAVNALRAELSIRNSASQQRMDIMDAAVKLQHEDMVRVPTEVQKATTATRELLEQVIARTAGEIAAEIAKVRGELNTQVSLSEEKFKSVQTQFTLLKQATEQLDLANKTAIAAALQAQKESAGETQKSSQAAIAKSETSTSEAIKTLTATFAQQFTAATDRFNDLKSRLDRGEGRVSASDPAIANGMSELMMAVKSLNVSRDTTQGAQAGTTQAWGYLIAAVGVFIPMMAMLAYFIKN